MIHQDSLPSATCRASYVTRQAHCLGRRGKAVNALRGGEYGVRSRTAQFPMLPIPGIATSVATSPCQATVRPSKDVWWLFELQATLGEPEPTSASVRTPDADSTQVATSCGVPRSQHAGPTLLRKRRPFLDGAMPLLTSPFTPDTWCGDSATAVQAHAEAAARSHRHPGRTDRGQDPGPCGAGVGWLMRLSRWTRGRHRGVRSGRGSGSGDLVVLDRPSFIIFPYCPAVLAAPTQHAGST